MNDTDTPLPAHIMDNSFSDHSYSANPLSTRMKFIMLRTTFAIPQAGIKLGQNIGRA